MHRAPKFEPIEGQIHLHPRTKNTILLYICHFFTSQIYLLCNLNIWWLLWIAFQYDKYKSRHMRVMMDVIVFISSGIQPIQPIVWTIEHSFWIDEEASIQQFGPKYAEKPIVPFFFYFNSMFFEKSRRSLAANLRSEIRLSIASNDDEKEQSICCVFAVAFRCRSSDGSLTNTNSRHVGQADHDHLSFVTWETIEISIASVSCHAIFLQATRSRWVEWIESRLCLHGSWFTILQQTHKSFGDRLTKCKR